MNSKKEWNKLTSFEFHLPYGDVEKTKSQATETKKTELLTVTEQQGEINRVRNQLIQFLGSNKHDERSQQELKDNLS